MYEITYIQNPFKNVRVTHFKITLKKKNEMAHFKIMCHPIHFMIFIQVSNC